MMNRRNPTMMLLGLALAGVPAMTAVAVAQQGPPPPGAWEPQEPQGNWSQAWHSGFHEGVEAARHDMQAGRQPDPDHHERFRHPDVPPDQRRDFREGFRRGYHMFIEHHGK
jgi:hypothetical protein